MGADRTLVLDLTGVTDKAALMDRCAAVLALPEWFGRNWDALADCLTDLPEPVVLVVTAWQEYAGARPREWATAQEVFAAAADERPTRLAVLLSLGSSPYDPTKRLRKGSEDQPRSGGRPPVGQ